MKGYTAYLLASINIIPHIAIAECQLVSSTQDSKAITAVADTETRITQTTIISRVCHITTRFLVGNKWFTVADSAATNVIGYTATDSELCAAAVYHAQENFMTSLIPDTLTTKTVEYCSEGTLHVHPVEEGDIIHYSEALPDPTRPGTFDFISPDLAMSLPDYDNPPGNTCEFFVELDPKNDTHFLYYGVRCKILHSNMWRVEIKSRYVSPNDEYKLPVDDQIVPIDGIIAPLNFWQTYMIGGATAPRGKQASIAKCNDINSYAESLGYTRQVCYTGPTQPTEEPQPKEGE